MKVFVNPTNNCSFPSAHHGSPTEIWTLDFIGDDDDDDIYIYTFLR